MYPALFILFLLQRLLKLLVLPHFLAVLIPVFTVTKNSGRFPYCKEVTRYVIKELQKNGLQQTKHLISSGCFYRKKMKRIKALRLRKSSVYS
jgi:hypothetical protein